MLKNLITSMKKLDNNKRLSITSHTRHGGEKEERINEHEVLPNCERITTVKEPLCSKAFEIKLS